MKTKIILTALFMLSALLSKGQQTIKTQAQPDSIIKVIPIESVNNTAYAYTIGGKLVTSEEVLMKLKAYAPSAATYHQAKNSITWSYISLAGSGLSGLAAGFAFRNSSKNDLSNMDTGHNHTGTYIFTGVAVAFLGSAIINFVHGTKLFKKSINVYNQRFE